MFFIARSVSVLVIPHFLLPNRFWAAGEAWANKAEFLQDSGEPPGQQGRECVGCLRFEVEGLCFEGQFGCPGPNRGHEQLD